MNNYRTCGIIGDVEGTCSAAFCLPVKRPTYVSCAVPSTSRQTHRRGVLCFRGSRMVDQNPPKQIVLDRWIGKQFGKLTVVGFHGRVGRNRLMWSCRCVCGQLTIAQSQNLINGNMRSCGCQRSISATKHGHSTTRTYSIWHAMINRCTYKDFKGWKSYGGRGIQVCERWKDFTLFLKDMGDAPDGYSIDRIDVNGNYEPGNCRWATTKQQARNRRNNRLITYHNETKTVMDWSQATGISPSTIYYRLNQGWTPDRLFKTPNYGQKASKGESS